MGCSFIVSPLVFSQTEVFDYRVFPRLSRIRLLDYRESPHLSLTEIIYYHESPSSHEPGCLIAESPPYGRGGDTRH